MNRCLTVVADASSRINAHPANVSIISIEETITRIIVYIELMMKYELYTMTLFDGSCSFRKMHSNKPANGHFCPIANGCRAYPYAMTARRRYCA